MTTFLLEIGVEELPAGFIPQALQQIKEKTTKKLSDIRLDFTEVNVYATPRRLVLFVHELSDIQKDIEREVQGPPVKSAFDANNNPTKAAISFAESQGVSVEQLHTKQTPKGTYICAIKKEKGLPTIELLPKFCTELITGLYFPKTMRWGSETISFPRPIRWLLSLFGDKVVNFSLGSIKSGNITFGHRYLCNKKQIVIEKADDYLDKLKSEGMVIVNQDERRNIIKYQLHLEAEKQNGKLIEDDELLDTVVNLVEYPNVICGKFSEEFLSLPSLVLITAMAEHQKFFSIVDENGKLLPRFLTVINNDAKYANEIIVGNEKVLTARLKDAQFFYEEDKKVNFVSRVEQLKGMMFQKLLGTVYDKVERIIDNVRFICKKLQVDEETKNNALRSALLCKADLVTNMIGEKTFTKLQGFIGQEYARISGENERTSRAIYEHYFPRFADDKLPETMEGSIVSIADKIDTIVGCFGIGLIPTGSEDPYALRRQSIGIIRIISNFQYKNSNEIIIEDLIEHSVSLLKDRFTKNVDETKNELRKFFEQRISTFLIENGFMADTVEAVISKSKLDIHSIQEKCKSLTEFRKDERFQSLVLAFKRTTNILKGVKDVGTVDESLFENDYEKELLKSIISTEEKISPLIKNKDYSAILSHLVELKEPIDNFFNSTMVMVENDKIRSNRQALLQRVANLFYFVADISKLSG